MVGRITRRRFIQGAAATAGLLVVPRLVRAQAPSEKLDIILVASGGRGKSHWGWAEKENVVAYCDVDDRELAQAAKRFPDAKGYRDYRKMFDEHAKANACVVSAPDHHHAPASLMAMQLGMAVYCEKPLCHSIAEARRMAEFARRYKVATQMGNQAHASTGLRMEVDWYRQGVIGKVREAHAWSDRPIWRQGISKMPPTEPAPEYLDWDNWIGPAPFREYHKGLHMFHWRGWWDFGTGALGDMGCHIIDPLFWGLELGSPTAVEVEQEGATPLSGPTWSRVTWHFPARGDHPPCKLTWHDGKKLPPAPEGIEPDRKWPSNGTMAIGDKGIMLCPHYGGPRLAPESAMADFQRPEMRVPKSPHGHSGEFIAAAKGGEPAAANFEYAAALTELVLLGDLAIRAGQRIEWDAQAMRVTNVPEANQFVGREYREGWRV